jgi:hypothetical protein
MNFSDAQQTQLYYNPQDVVEAWTFLLADKSSLSGSDLYCYDLVEVSSLSLFHYSFLSHPSSLPVLALSVHARR